MARPTLANAAAEFPLADAALPVDGFDASLRLTSRTLGTPLAAVMPDAAEIADAVAIYAAGARLLELGSVDLALRVSIVLDLVRSAGVLPEENDFATPLLTVRLPAGRAEAEAVLEDVGRSTGARFALAGELTPDQARSLGTLRPLSAVTLATTLDADGEAFARMILQEWADDLVLAFPPDADPAGIAPALERLRGIAESAGCTLALRAPADSPAALLDALSGAAAAALPVWLTGGDTRGALPAFTRGASLFSPADPHALRGFWPELVASARAIGTRRPSDLVLFGTPPDAAMRAAAELQFGKDTWLVAPVKNAVLALKRLSEARGGTVDSPLARESLANPPKECCLYVAEEPDLKEAATGWLYDHWVRETVRRRLAAG